MTDSEFRGEDYLKFLVSLDHVEASIRDNLVRVARVASKGVSSDDDQEIARRVCQYIFAIFMRDLSKEDRETVQKALESESELEED